MRGEDHSDGRACAPVIVYFRGDAMRCDAMRCGAVRCSAVRLVMYSLSPSRSSKFTNPPRLEPEGLNPLGIWLNRSTVSETFDPLACPTALPRAKHGQ